MIKMENRNLKIICRQQKHYLKLIFTLKKNNMKFFVLTTVLTIGLVTGLNAQIANKNLYEARYKQKQLELLKQSGINLTNAQADSVAAVNFEVWQQVRTLRSQAKLNDKKQDLEAFTLQRLTSALQSKTLAQQVYSYFKKIQTEQVQKAKQDSLSYQRH